MIGKLCNKVLSRCTINSDFHTRSLHLIWSATVSRDRPLSEELLAETYSLRWNSPCCFKRFFFCRPRLKPNGVSVLTRNSERLAEKSSLSLSNKNSQRSLSLLSSLHFRSGFIFSFIWLQGRKELTLCRVEFCRHFW